MKLIPVSLKAPFNNKILVIVGPTASGKTALAIEIAKQLNGEIICADSRTVYKGMDIGTAKPSIEEQKQVVHHCLDIITPDQKFTVVEFKKNATQILEDVRSRGKVPILVGGSGLYIDSVIYDYTFPASNLGDSLDQLSLAKLQDITKKHNYDVPDQIYMNKRHLAGFIKRGGVSGDKSIRSDVLIIGLDPGREVVVDRINKRTKKMMNEGFIDEVEGLLKIYKTDSPGLNAPGYKPMMAYIQGDVSLEEAEMQFIKNDKDLAKRQITWFKRNKKIKWFSDSDTAKSYIIEQWS